MRYFRSGIEGHEKEVWGYDSEEGSAIFPETLRVGDKGSNSFITRYRGWTDPFVDAAVRMGHWIELEERPWENDGTLRTPIDKQVLGEAGEYAFEKKVLDECEEECEEDDDTDVYYDGDDEECFVVQDSDGSLHRVFPEDEDDEDNTDDEFAAPAKSDQSLRIALAKAYGALDELDELIDSGNHNSVSAFVECFDPGQMEPKGKYENWQQYTIRSLTEFQALIEISDVLETILCARDDDGAGCVLEMLYKASNYEGVSASRCRELYNRLLEAIEVKRKISSAREKAFQEACESRQTGTPRQAMELLR